LNIGFFDTGELNPAAGGVNNVARELLSGLSQLEGVSIDRMLGCHASLVAALGKVGLGRLAVDNALLASERSIADRNYILPNYYLPHTATLAQARRSAVIVHDLQFRYLPQFFSRTKLAWLDHCMRRLSKSECVVVFISKTTEEDFIRFYGKPNRSAVIYNPVSSPAPRSRDIELPYARYLLASYHYYPHKNFLAVLALYETLLRRGKVEGLVVTGGGRQKIQELISRSAYSGLPNVHLMGHVTHETLASLRDGATAFVSLSLFEGFNLPAAECAIRRKPLLLSDIPVHKELFARYACLIPVEGVFNVDEIEEYLDDWEATGRLWTHELEVAPKCAAKKYVHALGEGT
jgi:glycosyltransferase involved in cell wall biosynthesis